MVSLYRKTIAEYVFSYASKQWSPETNHHIISRMTLLKPSVANRYSPCFQIQLTEADELSPRFIENFPTDKSICSVHRSSYSSEGNVIHFGISSKELCSEVIRETLSGPELKEDWGKNPLFPLEDSVPRNILVEYSSPNIAKSFHVGHLRSTIIGNFVSNIYSTVGHKVTRLNFLGDWGAQFGLLVAGLEDEGIKDIDSLDTLNRVYVKANSKAKEDELFQSKANDIFRRLEEGDVGLIDQWRQIRDVSVKDLKEMYCRLGITFDHYHGESMYNKSSCSNFIKELETLGFIDYDNGAALYRHTKSDKIPLTRSDGSSLYLSRDVAAVFDRFRAFKFDSMFYIVENGQSLHFRNLFLILKTLNSNMDCRHIKFGRIHGMSSRKGNVILLKDILNEAQQRCLERQDISANTRLDSHEEKLLAADICGITGLLKQDMSNKRLKDYPFDWNKAIRSKSDTFQYTHCRLSRLLSEQKIISEKELNVSLEDIDVICDELEAIELIYLIGIFDQVLKNAYLALEPYVLIKYSNSLCVATSKAFRTLSIKNANDPMSARSRVLLFFSAKRTLKRCLKILGIQPLNKM